jgi:hypothetical protein
MLHELKYASHHKLPSYPAALHRSQDQLREQFLDAGREKGNRPKRLPNECWHPMFRPAAVIPDR